MDTVIEFIVAVFSDPVDTVFWRVLLIMWWAYVAGLVVGSVSPIPPNPCHETPNWPKWVLPLIAGLSFVLAIELLA